MESSNDITPDTRASGAAVLFGVVTTLVGFGVIFVSFLIAPALALVLAYGMYLAIGRDKKRPGPAAPAAIDDSDANPAELPAYRFGTGA